MATYAIGDVQGCCDELEYLIEKLNFDPARDCLWFVGDLVNRGPKSLETLRLVKSLGDSAITVLGNHDLHLLALAANPEAPVPDKWLQPVLEAPDGEDIMAWLTKQPLAHYDAEINTLMVHAGIPPGWTLDDVQQRAGEVEAVLQSDAAMDFLRAMYGSKPAIWSEKISGTDRLRFITNALTRIRYCTREGELDFAEKLAPGKQPLHLLPWFELQPEIEQGFRIVFGHWSTLGLIQTDNIIATDTGCVWGGTLTAVRLDENAPPVQIESLQPKRFKD